MANLLPISQNNSNWARHLLGNGPRTIGSDGCLLCCLTMVADHGGQDLTPLDLNQTLLNDGRYIGGDLLADEALNGLYGAQFIDKRYFPNPLTPQDFTYVQDTYEDEYIIEIWIRENPNLPHFVRWFDGHDDASLRIYDPWDGSLCYLSKYGSPSRIIQKVVHYRVSNPNHVNPTPVPQPEPTPVVPVTATPAPVPEPVAEPAHPEVTGNGQPSGDIPVTVIQPDGTPVVAQPDRPEWETSYVPKDQDLTLETNAIAVDMETGDHKEFDQGTKMALAGTFSSNGVLYYRGRTSAQQGKWFGIPAESFSVLSNTDEGNWLLKDVHAAERVARFNPLAWFVRLLGRLPIINKLFSN